MNQSREEYRSHYARLAKEFANTPRVVTPHGLGQLQILDLRQDSGYGVGVMVDKMPNGETYRQVKLQAHDVQLLSEFKDQMEALFHHGPTWDGDLLSKGQRDQLQKLGLVEKSRSGFNLLTMAGVEEMVKAGWVSIQQESR